MAAGHPERSQPGGASHADFYYESGFQTDRLRQEIDPRGNATSYEYNRRGQVTKVTHEADGSSQQTGYNLDGTVNWTADEVNPSLHTTFLYDEYKRVTSITNPLNETVTKSYVPWNADGLTQQSSAMALSHTTSFVFRETSPTGKITDQGWDENRRLKWMRTATGTSEAATTNFNYDAVGNLITTQDPRGNTTTLGYDDRNRKTSATPPSPFSAQVTNWEYYGAGNVLWEIKPEVRTGVRPAVQREYDSMNRLWKEHEWAEQGNPATERITTYEYFPSGSTKAVIDPENKRTEFTYDNRNQKISMKYPDGSSCRAGFTTRRATRPRARPRTSARPSFSTTIAATGWIKCAGTRGSISPTSVTISPIA